MRDGTPARRPSTLLGLAVAVTLAVGAPAAAQSPAAGNGAPLSVVTAFYPVAEAAREVGGDAVAVTDLTPVGGRPHDLELTPRDIEVVAGADVVLYLGGGFQPQVAELAGQVAAPAVTLDVLTTVDLLPVDPQLPGTEGEVDGEVLEGGMDPHVWLDPLRQAAIAEAIAATLSEVDPDSADGYAARAAAYRQRLEALDAGLRETLADCDSRVIVTSHRAFGYFAERYGLVQIPIAGLSPEDEPDPRSLAAIAETARDNGVTTVFFESRVPRDFAQTVAREVGAATDGLDPVETLNQRQLDIGLDYATIMDQNRLALARGLGCAGE